MIKPGRLLSVLVSWLPLEFLIFFFQKAECPSGLKNTQLKTKNTTRSNMELEEELEEIFDNVSISDISRDILDGMDPGAIVLFCSSVIAGLSANLAMYEVEKDEPDEAIAHTLAAMVQFANTISALIPERYHAEAIQGLQHFDTAINLVSNEK